MAEKHIEKALRACAEKGVTETAVPWVEIRERALAGRREYSPRRRFVPRTRAGWVFAAVLLMLFSTGAYAVSEIAYDAFREELPGIGGEEDVGALINQTKRAHGAAVTLERVYADAGFVVVSFSVGNLPEERGETQPSDVLLPVFDIEEPWYERTGGSPPWPDGLPHVDLTDDTGREFQAIDAQGEIDSPPGNIIEGPKAQSVVFAAEKTLEPGRKHRFRFQVPLHAGDDTDYPPQPVGEPLAFDFEVAVRPTPIAEVDQREEAGGLALTLERVVESPGRPHAVLCFDPPQKGYVWEPLVSKTGVTAEDHPLYDMERRQMEDGCWAVDLYTHAEKYSLTVTEIHGYPEVEGYSEDGTPIEGAQEKEVLKGPWTFEFEVPGR